MENFARFHSGTYANQWMVLDFNHFHSGEQLTTGFFNVLEEIPGLVHYEDLTSELVVT